jgi:hypothetical protein
VVTVRNGGTSNGDRVQADCFLLEPESLKVCAMLSANYLTEVRTAAVSAIATRALARPDSRTLGVFGTGRQALAHLLLFSRSQQFELLFVDRKRREARILPSCWPIITGSASNPSKRPFVPGNPMSYAHARLRVFVEGYSVATRLLH